MSKDLKSGKAEEGELSEFLMKLGSTVRRKRKNFGLSRKRLAELSGISERYLAQLETGTGNVSVVILYKIAKALGYRPEDLLSFNVQEVAQKRGICFIGLRGAGKSTLGKALASDLSMEFVELNTIIEEQSGMPLGEVMALYGQEGYRELEFKALDSLRNRARIVLAVGGGLVSSSATYELLRQTFHTVWLKADPDDHMERVRAQGDHRPMSGNPQAMADLKRILTSREALYSLADATVETSGKSVSEVLAELKALASQLKL